MSGIDFSMVLFPSHTAVGLSADDSKKLSVSIV